MALFLLRNLVIGVLYAAYRLRVRVVGDPFVQETGVHNGAFGADKFGFKKLKGVNWNFGAPQLCEHSLVAGEAVLSADGALCADTGEFTGRSPKDKFTVRDATTDRTCGGPATSRSPRNSSRLSTR